MKTAFNIAALASLLVAPGVCFAEWDIELVTKDRAKKMGIEVRSQMSGPNQVRVELAFNADRELKNFSRVDLRFGEGDNPLLSVRLQEDRSKPRRVAVSFTADRDNLDKITLRVVIPEKLGGTIYQLQTKEFVELEKGR